MRSYLTAILIIRSQNLWIYVFIPGIISLAFGVLIAFGAQLFSGEVADFIQNKYPWEIGAAFVKKIAGFMGKVLVWAGALMAYKYVVLVLVSPFMSPLSERVEIHLAGVRHVPAGMRPLRFLRDIVRGIRIAIRNIVRELVLTLFAVLITGIFPFISFLSGVIVFCIQAYYAGFGNMDFTMERHFDVKGSVSFVRSYKGLAVGNGIPFLLLLMIPVLGVFLAPSLATVAATVETVERLQSGSGIHEVDLIV